MRKCASHGSNASPSSVTAQLWRSLLSWSLPRWSLLKWCMLLSLCACSADPDADATAVATACADNMAGSCDAGAVGDAGALVDGVVGDAASTPDGQEALDVSTDGQAVVDVSGDGATPAPPDAAALTWGCTAASAATCSSVAQSGASVGCDFWAVDLDNTFVPGGSRGYYDAAGAQYAIVVANTSAQLAANIAIENNAGVLKYDSSGALLDLSPLPPGQLRTYNLPSSQGVNGTSVSKSAFHITSSAPISAYQFNPLTKETTYSADASLLSPGSGVHFMVMSREQSFGMLRGFVTVVAIAAGLTTVDVTFGKDTIKTLASNDGSIAVYMAGESAQFELEQWDTLNLETDAVGADLTGTVILATQPVKVWAGSEAANAPNTNHCIVAKCTPAELSKGVKCGVCAADSAVGCFNNAHCASFITCCADHLEMEMIPVANWGSQYVAVKVQPQSSEPDMWRILAAQDGTTLTATPEPKGPKGLPISLPTLNKGQWFELQTADTFVLKAAGPKGDPAPILVGHFLAGASAGAGVGNIGDPAFLLAVAVAQWRSCHVFVTPHTFEFDYVSIAAPLAAQVKLDGKPLPAGAWKQVGKAYKWIRQPVAHGIHRVDATAPVAVDVYGWDDYTSYGYPAGMDLKKTP